MTIDAAKRFDALSDVIEQDIALNVGGGNGAYDQAKHSDTQAQVGTVLVVLVAGGDLTRQIHIHTKEKVGDLAQSLNAMTSNLSRLVGEVRQGTESMATASAQIAQGNAGQRRCHARR